MKRKLVALVLAIMLVGSCVGAMAATYGGYFEHLQNLFNKYYGTKVTKELRDYVISDEGIYMVYDQYEQYLNANENTEQNEYFEKWLANYNAQDNMLSEENVHLAKEAVAPYVAERMLEPIVEPIVPDDVVEMDQNAFLATHPGYKLVASIDGQYLYTDGVKFVLVKAHAETETPDIGGQITTGPDDFDLKYSNYEGSVISAFSFKPEVFGNGVTFSHKNAKSLCSMTVKSEAKVVIQLHDQQGRLYPISGATYSAADNGYVVTMKADESKTFGWYGTDGAGYHAAGSLAKPATITLDLNVWATTTGKNADGTAWATDRADMRFDYIVKHGDDAHSGNYSGSSSSPKTGDARMAYLTLASLVVLAGVAVVITRKLRTNA